MCVQFEIQDGETFCVEGYESIEELVIKMFHANWHKKSKIIL